jgi:hypothetical protein
VGRPLDSRLRFSFEFSRSQGEIFMGTRAAAEKAGIAVPGEVLTSPQIGRW